ncbi:MAG: FAD-binding protein [Ilumatobacteraceae bacterium]
MTATLVDRDPVLLAFAEEVGSDGPITVRGGGTRWNLGGPSTSGTRIVAAPSGIVTYAPEEMTVRVRAGTPVDELHDALRERGQRTTLVERRGTVGGAVMVGENDIHTLGRGTLRSSVLQIRYVSAEGRIVNGGGPTVKNVTGFDLPRLFVGSLGTLGLLAEVILRTNPIPPASLWLAAAAVDPFAVFDALQRASAVLWNGDRTWVLLEGHRADIDAQRAVLGRFGGFESVGGPPAVPSHRWSLPPADLRSLPPRLVSGAEAHGFVAVIGVGLAFCDVAPPARPVAAPIRALHERMKANFDPTGRLNPGRDPLDR